MRDSPDVLYGEQEVRLQDDIQVLVLKSREFKNSKILKSLKDIDAEPDINRNPDFFSY